MGDMTKQNKIVIDRDREKVFHDIGLALKKQFKNNILGVAVYGSAARDDFDNNSDFDLFLVFLKFTTKDIEKLRKIRFKFLRNKIILDFNVQTIEELPQTRKKAFWHNNRSFFFQKELQVYNKQIIGENFFKKISFSRKEIKLEAVRMINSYLYRARGILINEDLKYAQKIAVIKYCIYAVCNALMLFDKYPVNRKTAFYLFHRLFKTEINPICFFNIKNKRKKIISKSDLDKALNFLTELDRKVYNIYKKS